MTKKQTKHPLESFFDIEQGSTELNLPQVAATTEDKVVSEDEKVINEQLNTIYRAALETYQNQYELSQLADPRFAARSAEVGAQFLQIALHSTKARIAHTASKQKVEKTTNVTNNNLVMDRNDLMKMLKDKTGA